MTERDVLQALLVTSVVLAALLILIAMASIGRRLTDLEYQQVKGITGVPRIQAWINLRAVADRALLGVVFVVINALLLAGAPEIVRMWANRLLWTLLLLWVVAWSIVDWFSAAKQVRLMETAADEERTRLRESDAESIDSYRQMAAQAIDNLEVKVLGLPDAPRTESLAPVIPEHSSPTTERQRRTADIATLRARLVAANLALGIPADPEPPAEAEEEQAL